MPFVPRLNWLQLWSEIFGEHEDLTNPPAVHQYPFNHISFPKKRAVRMLQLTLTSKLLLPRSMQLLSIWHANVCAVQTRADTARMRRLHPLILLRLQLRGESAWKYENNFIKIQNWVIWFMATPYPLAFEWYNIYQSGMILNAHREDIQMATVWAWHADWWLLKTCLKKRTQYQKKSLWQSIE